MARTRKPASTIQTPTVTDDQYAEGLAIRLAAMKGFDAGTVDAETKNAARAWIRNARKVRKAEEANGILPAYRAEQERLAQEAEAKKAARPKRTRTPKVATTTEPEPNEPEVTDPEPTDQVLENVA